MKVVNGFDIGKDFVLLPAKRLRKVFVAEHGHVVGDARSQ